jgi:hypothetical protein
MIRILIFLVAMLVPVVSGAVDYTVYDNTTGIIYRYGKCTEIEYPQQRKQPYEKLMRYRVTTENYVVNGTPVYVPQPDPDPAVVAALIEADEQRQVSSEKLFKVLFWLVNHVRALEGQQAITAEQMKNFLRGM